MACRRNGGVCLWERSTPYSKGSRGASRRYSTHLSEGMPSVLLLCLLCMAYHSSQHGPALEMQFKSTTGYLRERPGAWCLYLQIFSSELMYYFTCDGASTRQCKRLYLNMFSKSPLTSSYLVSGSLLKSRCIRRSGCSAPKLPVWRRQRYPSTNQRLSSSSTPLPYWKFVLPVVDVRFRWISVTLASF